MAGSIAWAIMVVVFATFPMPAEADDASVLQRLNVPGVHAIMRHALAPGTGDPAGFMVGDCSTQRNLDDRGRDQARAIGKALRKAGVTFDRVLTSQWCRCRETAELLGLGTPQEFPALNSFFQDRSTADRQTEEVRAFISSLPEDQRVLLVTHQVNISALTGRGLSSGEVYLIRNHGGSIEIVGEFLLRP